MVAVSFFYAASREKLNYIYETKFSQVPRSLHFISIDNLQLMQNLNKKIWANAHETWESL